MSELEIPEETLESIRHRVRTGQRLVERGLDQPEGSRRQAQSFKRARIIVERAVLEAADYGIEPGEFDRWAHELTYGPEAAEIAQLEGQALLPHTQV